MLPVFHLPLVVSDMSLDATLPRCALRGSLDPTTGIFYKAPERARVRTPQACDKCRVRKAKCSGDHPVCERCRVRGLVCHYAPERRARRWNRAMAEEAEAVLDRSSSRALPNKTTAIAHGPRIPDAGRPWDTKDTVRPSRISADIRSSEEEDSVQPCSTTVLNAPEPLKNHVVLHGVLETMRERGHGTSDDDVGVPFVEDDPLGLSFAYAGDPHPFVEAFFVPRSLEATPRACVIPADFEHTDLRRDGYHEGGNYAINPPGLAGTVMSFHHPPCSPRAGSHFPVDPDIQHNHERRCSCCVNESESSDWTPSTSLSASPAVTRSPPTPTNNHLSPPFPFSSLLPFLGPCPSGPPYSFVDEVSPMDMRTDTDGAGTEYLTSGEVKDYTCAFGADVGLFLDLDAMFL